MQGLLAASVALSQGTFVVKPSKSVGRPKTASKARPGLSVAPAVLKRKAAPRVTRSEGRAVAAAAMLGGSSTATSGRAVRLPAAGAAAAPAADARTRLKRVLQPRKVMPAHSTKPLTMPDEVNLRVSKRTRRQCDEEEVGSEPPPTAALLDPSLAFGADDSVRFFRD